MKEFTGKTVFITGGSRGIGYAMAMRFAKAGANLVIAAKDKSENLQVVSESLLAEGASVFVIEMDAADEKSISATVIKAISKFNHIDILINNVSTFCFNDTLSITAAQFDLLFAVNTRATFLVSQACIPSLKTSENPHIINIAPPLDMDPKWFVNHLAFTMSKFGMSMCTLGMASEFKSLGIAVNALWPKTTIATSTIQDHFQPHVFVGSRWPTIMADAAHLLAQKNAKQHSGAFYIDEDILRQSGMTDFTGYAVDPHSPLVEDLFIPASTKNVDDNHVALVRDMYI